MNIIPSPTQPREAVALRVFNELCDSLAGQINRIQDSDLPAHQKHRQTATVYHRLMRLTLAGQWIHHQQQIRLDILAPAAPYPAALVGERSFKGLRACTHHLPFEHDIDIYPFPNPYRDFTTTDFQYQFVTQACLRLPYISASPFADKCPDPGPHHNSLARQSDSSHFYRDLVRDRRPNLSCSPAVLLLAVQPLSDVRRVWVDLQLVPPSRAASRAAQSTTASGIRTVPI